MSARTKSVRAPVPPESVPQAVKRETGFSSSYVEFAKTLRTWFVAYGIGAPVFVLGQDTLRASWQSIPDARFIAECFLGGVALQVIAALVYKISMWYLYMGELDEEFCNSTRYEWSESISVALWLEVLFDVGTIGLFGYATVRMLDVLGK